jgi:hypothetical protein
MIRFLIKVFISILILYGIFWLFSIKNYPVSFGISFDHEYAKYLGLDWKKTYQAILQDLNPKYIRVSAKWNAVEPTKDVYNFDDTDYLINEAGKKNSKILLAIGQKVPRWPECYFPDWSKSLKSEDRKAELLKYVEKVVNRYKNNPALEMWQVENEPFISFKFGECAIFDSSAVADEIALVRKSDSKHKILITDSGELSTWYPAAKTGDIFGTTLYRVVRSSNGMIWRYDWLPAGFYKIKTMLFGLSPDTFFVSELQAEPWFSNGGPTDTPLSIQSQTFNLNQFKKNTSYAEHLGTSRAYLWGVEWWYWMKTTQGDESYWDFARETLKK